MEDSTLHNFHVPLPEEIYSKLREEAERSKRPATALARQAIEDWLRQREKAALSDAIAAYAAEHAGGDVDLDKELEAAAVEHLLEEGKRR